MNIYNFYNNKKKLNIKVGLCLSGGGAKGFVHLGVIKAFEEYGIKFDMISGCSIGSAIACMYADDFDFKTMYDIMTNVNIKEIKNGKFKLLPSNSLGIEELAKKYFSNKLLEDLNKKIFINAVDLKSGQEIYFSKGNIGKIVAGSCAVPVIFNPVKYDKYYLVDGGILDNLPAIILKNNGADFVISVDINPKRGTGTDSEKFINCLLASFHIAMKNNVILGYLNSDLVIKPDTRKFKSTKIKNIDEMIEIGYKATVELMPKIFDIFNGKLEKKQIINF